MADLSQAPSQAQSPGIVDQLTGILAHPLVQGALATYLGAVSTPRYEGLGTAIGRGGLAGLGQFGQAEELQQQLPQQAARTQLLKQQAAQGPVQQQLLQQQAQQGALQLAPISPDEIKKLDLAIAAAPTQQEKGYYSFLKTEYQNRRLSAQDLAARLDPHLAALLNAQAKMYGNQLGFAALTGGTLPAPPSAGPTMGAPPPPATTLAGPGGAGTTADPSWASSEGDSAAGLVGLDATDGRWYHVNPDGSKGAAYAAGVP